MVDAADPEKIEASKNELHNLLDKPQLQGIPVRTLLEQIEHNWNHDKKNKPDQTDLIWQNLSRADWTKLVLIKFGQTWPNINKSWH